MFVPDSKMKSRITKKVWILSIISLVTDMASEMLYPIMPLYLTSIGLTMAFIGFLEGVAEFIAGISKGYFGQLSDKWQKRVPFIRVGYTLSSIAKPLMVVFKNPWWVLLMRSADRLGKGVRTSARDALLADESTPENRGRVFGVHRSMDTLGATLGAIAAYLLISMQPGNFESIFAWAIVPGIVTIFLCFLLKEKSAPAISNDVKVKVNFLSYFKYWKKATPGYRKLSVGLLLFYLFNTSDVFLLLFLKQAGYNDLYVIGAYICYNVFYAALAYPFGKLSDRVGYKMVFVIGLACFIATYTLLPYTTGYWLPLLLFAIYGSYSALTEGISKAWISQHCLPHEKGTAFGLYGSGVSLALIISNTFMGYIWDAVSPQFALLLSAGGAAICMVYFLIWRENKLPHQ